MQCCCSATNRVCCYLPSELIRPWQVKRSGVEEDDSHRPPTRAQLERLQNAYKPVLLITMKFVNNTRYIEFSREIKRIAKSKYNATYPSGPVHPFVGCFHDSLLLYAHAVNQTLIETGNWSKLEDGFYMSRAMWNRSFKGITGNVVVNNNGDRKEDYSLIELDPETKLFTKNFATFIGYNKSLIFDPNKSVNHIPRDVPKCGFDGKLCAEKNFTSWTIALILGVCMLGGSVLVACIFYRRGKHQAELNAMNWLIHWNEIDTQKKMARKRSLKTKKNSVSGGGGGSGSVVVFRQNLVNYHQVCSNGGADGGGSEANAAVPSDSNGHDDCMEAPVTDARSNQAKSKKKRRLDIKLPSLSYSNHDLKKIQMHLENQPRRASSKSHNSASDHHPHQHHHTATSDAPNKPNKKSVFYKMKKDHRNSTAANFFRKSVDRNDDDGDDDNDDNTDLVSGDVGTNALDGDTHHGGRARTGSISSIYTFGGVQMNNLDKPGHVFIETGIYRGVVCALKPISMLGRRIDINNKEILQEVKKVKDLNSNYLVRFIGICLDINHEHILCEYCSKGSLMDVLEGNQVNLDWTFKISLMVDVVRGMMYLHENLGVHGNLKSSNCLVDSRFVVKISDFGLPTFRESVNEHYESTCNYYKDLLWTAPEILRIKSHRSVNASQSEKLYNEIQLQRKIYQKHATIKSDVYSFGIVAQEIYYRNGAFFRQDDTIYDPREIIERVVNVEQIPFRPSMAQEEEVPPNLTKMIMSSWHEDPNVRPDFAQIKSQFRRLKIGEGNILDNLLARMEQYANNLEGLVKQRTSQYYEEKKKAEDLLYSMLPKSVAGQLIRGEPVTAESYDSVSIYFSDICGFTALSASSTPMQVVKLLNQLYTVFDSTLEIYDVYKVETIGDAYMVVSGLPQRNGLNHAREIARMSLAFLNEIQKFRIPHMPDTILKLRIGIHTGGVVAGVVGLKMPRYCLFGDTVNTASRMESNGEPMKIHISEATKSVLDTFDSFITEPRGLVEMKGKGQQQTFWLNGEHNQAEVMLDPILEADKPPDYYQHQQQPHHQHQQPHHHISISGETAAVL